MFYQLRLIKLLVAGLDLRTDTKKALQVQGFIEILKSNEIRCNALQLFPFDGGWWLARHVIHHAVDAADFVDDAIGHGAEQVVWQVCPVCGHEVVCNHVAQCHHVVKRAASAQHAH